MGFYVHKSTKIGPIRLNYSKSGVGVSAGVRGARISTGPRGTYVTVGAGGVYYRKKLNGVMHGQPEQSSGDSTRSSDPEFMQSSGWEALNEINERIALPTYVGRTVAISSIVAFSVAGVGLLIAKSSPILSWTL